MMKRIILLLFLCAPYVQVEAQEISTEREYYYLKQAESKIFTLPFDVNHIHSVFIPEIHANRTTLAPHYPDRSTLPRNSVSVTEAFHNWIEIYPTEYAQYLSYLSVFYREHN